MIKYFFLIVFLSLSFALNANAYTYTTDKVTYGDLVFVCMQQDETLTDGPDCYYIGNASTTILNANRSPYTTVCYQGLDDSNLSKEYFFKATCSNCSGVKLGLAAAASETYLS